MKPKSIILMARWAIGKATSRLLLLAVLLAIASSASAQSITNPIAVLKKHILGTTNLTAAQIVTYGDSIDKYCYQISTNSVALAAALDLVTTYDNTKGAIFTTTTTKNGLTRDAAGFELAQALFDFQQGIIDKSYNNQSAKLTTYYQYCEQHQVRHLDLLPRSGGAARQHQPRV